MRPPECGGLSYLTVSENFDEMAAYEWASALDPHHCQHDRYTLDRSRHSGAKAVCSVPAAGLHNTIDKHIHAYIHIYIDTYMQIVNIHTLTRVVTIPGDSYLHCVHIFILIIIITIIIFLSLLLWLFIITIIINIILVHFIHRHITRISY